jgi:hypothetical protein
MTLKIERHVAKSPGRHVFSHLATLRLRAFAFIGLQVIHYTMYAISNKFLTKINITENLTQGRYGAMPLGFLASLRHCALTPLR